MAIIVNPRINIGYSLCFTSMRGMNSEERTFEYELKLTLRYSLSSCYTIELCEFHGHKIYY